MGTNSDTPNEIQLNDAELNCVVGGSHFSGGWTPSGIYPTLANPPSVNVPAIEPIHLAPLPPLHTAVPHF
jgi:hypothetical protein